MKKHVFSIIVACYNEETVINRCVNSLLNQTYKDYEIIVINDGSMDKTKEILDKNYSKNKKIKLIHKKTNEDKPKRINEALKAASGRIIAITDADSVVPKTWLSNIKKEFDNTPELKAVGGVYEAIDNDVYSITGNLFERIFMDIGIIPNILPGANAAYIKKDFLEIKGYPLRKWGADSMIDMRMREKKKKIKITKNISVKTGYPTNLKSIIKRKFYWGGGLASIMDKTNFRLNLLIRPLYFILLLASMISTVIASIFNSVLFNLSLLVFLILFLLPASIFLLLGGIWIIRNKKPKYLKSLPLLIFMPFIQEFSYFIGFWYVMFGGRLSNSWRQ